MDCRLCSSRITQQNDAADCFEAALETIKQHYTFYRNIARKRDLEMLQLKERNTELLKALQLLQKAQPSAKRFKANMEGSWVASSQTDRNTYKEDTSTDVSLAEDDDNDVRAGASCLNMALNSEQLFETSLLSPQPNVSHSEVITSPSTKESPGRNKQRDEARSLIDQSKQLRKSKSVFHIKQRSSPDKSWASKFITPAVKVKVTESCGGPDMRKPEKRLNLSLKKINANKMKQSLLYFNKSKNSNLVESDRREEVIDASPVVVKNSKDGFSRAQRSVLSHDKTRDNSGLVSTETRQSHEDTTSVPIENILFDFSPSKKPDHAGVSDGKLSSKKLNFDKEADETTGDSSEMGSGQTTMGSQSSSVVFLTPATQDIIFVDDTCDEFNNADTLDLLADIMKQDNTETLQQYERKNMEMHLQQIKTKSMCTKENQKPVAEPLPSVKKEKFTQLLIEKSKEKDENILKGVTALKQKDRPLNALLQDAHDDDDDEEEEDDAMPRPILIKQEFEKKKGFKKGSLMERFNINCEECEKYLEFFGHQLTDDELSKHINQCLHHKQADNLHQNTPDGFWNPFILSFPQNDPRNEVLFDNRFKNKEKTEKH